ECSFPPCCGTYNFLLKRKKKCLVGNNDMFLVTTQAPLSLSTKTFSPSQFSKPKLKSLSRNPNKTLNLTVANASDSKPPSISASSPPFQSDLPVSVKVPLEGVIQFEKPSFAKQINKWGRVALFAAGDVLALLLFAGIGRFSHGFPVFDVETLHTADPFIAGWFLSAYFLGGYGSDGRGMNGSSKAIAAAAKSWVAGIPVS
ncbi:hypothetical protein GIB67_018946, partial [Kingdonia uniflora]